MRILLVLNKPNRETPIMESIKSEVLSLSPDAQVEIWEMCTHVFNQNVLQFKPHVILTFPFTSTGFSSWYYIFKRAFNCKLLSLRAEGVVDFTSDFNVQWACGCDVYGKNLVDYELFWGRKMAEVVGSHLIRQGKLSSKDRIKYVGYPRLESYFSRKPSAPSEFPARILDKIKNYPRNRIIAVITGFQLANYTRSDLFRAGDLDAANNIDMLLASVEIAKRFRQAWIDRIAQAAGEHPDALFVVKKHPIEKRGDYKHLEQHPNILYIYEDIEIQDLIALTGLFIHYGSTSLVDAYLSKIPSIYVSSAESQKWYSDLGWPSTRKIDISDFSGVIKEFLANTITFQMTPEIQQVLKDIFDIELGKPYRPSRKIAELIVNPEPGQKIPIDDAHLWRSIVYIGIHGFRPWIAKTLKRILRKDPNAPLFK